MATPSRGLSIRSRAHQSLQKRGLWKDYQVLYAQKKSEGFTPAEALRYGMSVLMPDWRWADESANGPGAAPAADPVRVAGAGDGGGVGGAVVSGAVLHGAVTPGSFPKAKGKKNLAKDTQWVYDNLPFDLADVDLPTCPSSGAYALLKWARDPENVGEFYKIWAKLLPTKTQLGAVDQDSLSADATVQVEFLEKVKRARAKAMGEVVADAAVSVGVGDSGAGGVGGGAGVHVVEPAVGQSESPRAEVPPVGGTPATAPGNLPVEVDPEW